MEKKKEKEASYIVWMEIDKPAQDTDAVKRFVDGVQVLSRELPRVRVIDYGDFPSIVIGGETEDELHDYVHRLQQLTDGLGG